MIAEINVDNDRKIIQRTLMGEIDPNQALSLIREIAFSAKHHQDYNILVDIRDTTFQPGSGDLLEIAAECSKRLVSFNRKIAFIIPDTDQRKKVTEYFRTCMETQGFKFMQFFDYETAMEWLAVEI